MHKDYCPPFAPQTFIRLFLILLVIAAAIVRLHHFDAYYYSPDESMHSNIAGGDGLVQVLAFSRYEIHPPVFYVLAHYWMAISTDPTFVRGLSLLFGLLIIPLYYKIGKASGGAFAGLCCACLIAFSHGAIIQSYVVRHYMVFLFFESVSFYGYLLWRIHLRKSALATYAVFGILACLTHFSGIFFIVCIAGFEAVSLLKNKAPFLRIAFWGAVNAVIAVIAVYVYHLWQPILVPLKSYFIEYELHGMDWVKAVLLYPVVTAEYIFPDRYADSFILGIMVVYGCVPEKRFNKRPDIQPLLALSGGSLLLALILFITGIYPFSGTRHNFWLLPLILPMAGTVIGDMLTLLSQKIQSLRLQTLAIAVLLISCATYSTTDRFSDGSEYVWPTANWDAFTRYLAALGPTDMIITEKDDGIQLANLYRNMGDDAFTGKTMASIAPYKGTHILFNPYYPRNYSSSVFIATLQDAQNRHLLNGADRLVFLRMAWSRSPLTDIILCDGLQKQLVAFPAFPPGPLTRDTVYSTLAILMIVQKQPFMDALMDPNSKVRGCLDGKHDMVPSLTAIMP